MVRNMASDTIDFSSYLNMSINFFQGPEIISNARKTRKVCGLTFPFPEIIAAGGAVPIFIPRLNKGRRYEVIQAALTARNILGINTLSRGLDFLKRVDTTGTVINVAGNLINDIILSLNETYEDAVAEGEELGMPIDHCYGAKALFGLYRKLGNQLDMNLGIDIRCSVFFNYHEALSINEYVKNNFIMDMPYTDDNDSISFFVSEINDFISFQEKITGKRFSMDRFREILVLTNEARAILKEIYTDICSGDLLPCSPATFSELNSLLVYSFIDYNSRLQEYVGNLRKLVQEIHDRIDSSAKRFDATGMPRLIYSPIFGGFEPEIAFMADELGARVYYPDWFIYGLLEPVKTTGNLIRNYAEHMMRFQRSIGLSNEQMARKLIDVSKIMNVDGIIFCEVFGCRSMCTGHRTLKDMIRSLDLEIPVTVITYNNMGDSLEQVKTRVSALLEMIKE